MTRMTLSSIITKHEPLPPRIVLYGPHGIGKTSFGVSAPSPIVIRTEDGLGTLQVPAFPMAAHYTDVIGAIETLYRETHGFQTVVLDSLDWLEPLVWSQTALEGGKTAIEDFGFGKGYKYADEYWQRILDGLNALRGKGMTVICLAHANIKRFDAPDTEPYDRYQIKLHERASSLVQEWADVVGFAHYEIHTVETDVGFNKKVQRGVGVGNRILSVEERPAYYAKNRFALPADLPLSWNAFVTACSAAYDTAAEQYAAIPEPVIEQALEEEGRSEQECADSQEEDDAQFEREEMMEAVND